MLKRLLVKTMLITIVGIVALFLLCFIGGVILEYAQEITSFTPMLNEHSAVLMVWRYSVMMVFVGFYPALVHRFFRGCHPATTRLEAQVSQRRYAILLCLGYEMLLVQGGLAWLVNSVLHW